MRAYPSLQISRCRQALNSRFQPRAEVSPPFEFASALRASGEVFGNCAVCPREGVVKKRFHPLQGLLALRIDVQLIFHAHCPFFARPDDTLRTRDIRLRFAQQFAPRLSSAMTGPS